MDKCSDLEKGKYIYDYCFGLLTEEEEAAFEMHLFECKYCRSKVSEVASLCEIFKHYDFTKKEYNFFNIRVKKLLAIAATLAFLLPGIPMLKELLPLPEDKNFINAVVRGEKGGNYLFAKGLENYNGEHFKEAEKYFREYLKKNPENFDANFLMGLSLLKEGKKDGLPYLLKAEKIGDAIFKKTGNYRYLAKTYYYLGKVFLKFGDRLKSKEYFEKYLSFKDPLLIHNDEVKSILEKIN